MEKFSELLTNLKSLFLQVTETGFALVAFIVLVYLLLGEASGAYVISVVTNVSLLVNAISPQSLIAIAIIIGLYYLVQKRAKG